MKGISDAGFTLDQKLEQFLTPDLVIFDCDGVLVDSEPITERVLSANLTRYGLAISPDEVSALFIGGTLKAVGARAQEMGADLPDDWLTATYAEIGTELAKGVALFPGVFDLLDALAVRGIALAIASNGPISKMEITLKPSGLWDRFAGRILTGHAHRPKPAPDMLLHACKVAGTTPDRAVMIDDSVAGCRAAQNAQMRCYGFLPHGDAAPLARVGAVPARSFAEIARELGLD